MTTFSLREFIIIQIGLLEFCNSKYGKNPYSVYLFLASKDYRSPNEYFNW